MLGINRKSLILPFLVLATFIAFCLVRPVSADDGQTTDDDPIAEEIVAADTGADLAVENEDLGGNETPVAVSGVNDPVIERDAEVVILEGDPYYKIGTTTHSYATFTAALNSMETYGTPSDRKLYVEAGSYSEMVEVDGTANGVKGLTGIVGLGSKPTDVTLSGKLYIHDMAAGFTVSNMEVTNTATSNSASIWVQNNKGTTTLVDVMTQSTHTDSSGIVILNSVNVVLNRVDSSNNAYKGADLYNISGTVTILNCVFDANLNTVSDGVSYESGLNRTALNVYTTGAGAVILNGVAARENLGDAVNINSAKATITVKDSYIYYNDPAAAYANWGSGITVTGNIVNLDNDFVTLNDGYGIYATVNSSFTGTNLNVLANDEEGLYIWACWGAGPCTNTGPGTVTIKNALVNINGGDGIYARAKGAITIYDVNASSNTLAGLELNNQFALVVPVTLTRVTASGGGTGTLIHTKGAVTITNFVANSNDFQGLYIDSTGTGAINITINPVYPEVFNETSENGAEGYWITTLGPVSITSLDCHENGSDGGLIDNGSALSAQPVTIKVLDLKNTHSSYYENDGDGLNILSRGAVTLTNIYSYSNGGKGLYIDNLPASATSGPGVTISDGIFSSNCGPLGACSYAIGHSYNGVSIYSRGTITLKDVDAYSNDGYGVFLYNGYSGATAGVVINGSTTISNTVTNNSNTGLYIYTNGAITITNISASYNQGSYGAYLNNHGGTGAVTINQIISDRFNGNSFSSNGGTGLYIYTKGTVKVAFDNANANDSDGIYISASGGSGAVSISGKADYDDNVYNNSGSGVEVYAKGTITLTNLDCYLNDDYGAYLSNTSGTGSVVVTNATFNSNLYGLYAVTNGTLTWKNGFASSNTEDGAYLRPKGAATLTLISVNSNGDDGIDLNNSGSVTFSSVTGSSNTGTGIWVDTTGVVLFTDISTSYNDVNGTVVYTDSTFTMNKPVYDYNYFIDNFSLGLFVNAAGKITITRVDAEMNGSTGVSLTVTNAAGIAPILLTDIISNENTGDGALITTNGAVTITKFTADENDTYGLHIDQTGSPSSAYAVKLTNMSASHNAADGIYVEGLGSITLSKFYVYSNTGCGVFLDNSTGTGTVTVLNPVGGAYNNIAKYNSSDGLRIYSKGTVNVTGVETYGNGGYGLNIYNNTSTTNAAVTVTTVITRSNSNNGINIYTLGIATVNNVFSYTNTHFGIDIHAPTTIYIKNSGAVNNTWAGIATFMGGSGKTYLSNCTWFGNQTSNTTYGNLYVSGGDKVIS